MLRAESEVKDLKPTSVGQVLPNSYTWHVLNHEVDAVAQKCMHEEIQV